MFDNVVSAIQESSMFPQHQPTVKVLNDPRALVFTNFFTKDINQRILEEAINNKDKFTQGTIGNGEINLKVRSNMTSYYDSIYPTVDDRKKSVLLSAIDKAFTLFQEVLTSAGYPFCDFAGTTYHETQVSRYGDNGQKYDWHVDRYGQNMQRHITLVYYFFKEPKAFQGGEIWLSDGVIYNGNLLNPENARIHKIVPENNMAIVFSSTSAHCVTPCTSPDNFEDGRFSVNCWIGYKTGMYQDAFNMNQVKMQ